MTDQPGALDALGVMSANGADAYEFVKAWHGGGSDHWLVAINQMKIGGGIIHTVAAPLSSMLDILQHGDLDELVYMNSDRWNLYHSAGFLIKKPERGRRSGKKNIKAVPGVWLDLDVKSGAFSSESEAVDFAMSLPLQPTILTATGAGGVQAYWRCTEVLAPDTAEELCVRWWQHCSKLAPVAVDKIQNRDRILRLPGSVRWPKDSESPTLARLMDTGGPLASVDALYSITERVHQEAVERKRAAYADLQETGRKAALAVRDLGRWDVLWAITHLEEQFNERYDWTTILEPAGWSNIGEDYDGRTLWSRPGGNNRKSATTDWPESPHTMSLFSDAEETGLRRLADAEVPLTKYRVYIELYWRGDEEGFVRAWVKQLQDEGKVQ